MNPYRPYRRPVTQAAEVPEVGAIVSGGELPKNSAKHRFFGRLSVSILVGGRWLVGGGL